MIGGAFEQEGAGKHKEQEKTGGGVQGGGGGGRFSTGLGNIKYINTLQE